MSALAYLVCIAAAAYFDRCGATALMFVMIAVAFTLVVQKHLTH